MNSPTADESNSRQNSTSNHSGLQSDDARIKLLENQIHLLLAENRQLKQQWKEATSSLSWRLVTKLSRTARGVAPQGSIRRKLLKNVWHGLMAVRRRGPLPFTKRLAVKTKAKLVEFVHDRSARARPFVADHRPVVLAVSHIGGGGTERHVRDMACRLLAEGVRTIYTRPDPRGRLVFEERDAGWNVRWRRVIGPDSDQIGSLFDTIKPSLAHVHHTMGVPKVLFEQIQQKSLPTDWTLHDYHSVCPRIHLQNEQGRYCGEPDTHGCNNCLKKLGDYHGKIVNVDIDNYRLQWSDRLASARRIYVPSDDVKQRLARYFPELQIETRPHMEPSRPERLLARRYMPGERVRVAVIGTIGSIKGSAQLLQAARDAAVRNLPLEFVLVGTSNLEPQLLATGRVELTGPYFENEIWDRLDEAACHVAWLPSIWPETYMYTLSVAQLAGLWPVVYNMGAQAQRVVQTSVGNCISLDTTPEQLNNLFIEKAEQLSLLPGLCAPEFAEYPNFLENYYGLSLEELKSFERNDCIFKASHSALKSNSLNISNQHASRSDHARLYQHHSQLSA